MTVWYTSDLHLEHEKVALLRGFASVDEHDRAILANIANTLHKGDHLWVLGDISKGTARSEHAALDKLNMLTPFFDLHLVAGNHDTVHPMHVGSHIRQAKFAEVFCSVQSVARRRITGLKHTKLWLSHFPYFGDGDRNSTEDRYPETRLHDNGHDYLLHGHLHTDQQWTAERSIHIGLDAWNLHPVALETVTTMIVAHARTPIAA